MQVYVVNELCELEQDNYINCHGVFTDKEKAYQVAIDAFEQAKEDIGGEYCTSDLKVWNDNNISTIEVAVVELDK